MVVRYNCKSHHRLFRHRPTSTRHQENLKFYTTPKGAVISNLNKRQKTNKNRWWIIQQVTAVKNIHAQNNVVCNTLRLEGSWSLVTLNSREGERGGKQKMYFLRGCPIREEFLRERLLHQLSIQICNARLQKFSPATHWFSLFTFSDLSWMRQLLLHSVLFSCFTSKYFHFF